MIRANLPVRSDSYQRSDSIDPLSELFVFGVREAVASSCTLARIGPNGPNLCCGGLKLTLPPIFIQQRLESGGV